MPTRFSVPPGYVSIVSRPLNFPLIVAPPRQPQAVFTRVKVPNFVVAGENCKLVIAWAAKHEMFPRAAAQRVSAGAAIKVIKAVVGIQLIIPRSPIEKI